MSVLMPLIIFLFIIAIIILLGFMIHSALIIPVAILCFFIGLPVAIICYAFLLGLKDKMVDYFKYKNKKK